MPPVRLLAPLRRTLSSNRSSGRWLARQQADPFVRAAAAQGYRSRAAFKLLQLDAKFRILAPGTRALDLGAAPGSWTQVLVKQQIETVAVDLLPIQPLEGCTVVQGDFTEPSTLSTLLLRLGGSPVDLIVSDLSPSRSGHKSLDHCRLHALVVRALQLARRTLRPGGTFLPYPPITPPTPPTPPYPPLPPLPPYPKATTWTTR